MSSLTSRERMLRAIRQQVVDYTPCAFMSFSAMRGRVQDAYEGVQRELEMGLDSMLFIPSAPRGIRPNHPDLRGLPVHLPTEVRVDLWVERLPGEHYPILPDGLRAVLDWELAHVGDPMEDLGWICANPWRFGVEDKPVGGFGQREDLWAGYEAAGGVPVDPRAHWWEVFGCCAGA